MNLQKIHVKLFVDAPDAIDLTPLLTIFARWREDRQHPARWVDLADYAHVPKGPAVLLIGKQGHFGIDFADPGPGLIWTNKQDLDGSIEDRTLETFRRALRLTAALLAEPEYPSRLSPRLGFWELSFNDRLDAPNSEATDRRLRPAVEAAVRRLLGPDCAMIRQEDPERRYGFILHSDSAPSLGEITSRIEIAAR